MDFDYKFEKDEAFGRPNWAYTNAASPYFWVVYKFKIWIFLFRKTSMLRNKGILGFAFGLCYGNSEISILYRSKLRHLGIKSPQRGFWLLSAMGLPDGSSDLPVLPLLVLDRSCYICCTLSCPSWQAHLAVIYYDVLWEVLFPWLFQLPQIRPFGHLPICTK